MSTKRFVSREFLATTRVALDADRAFIVSSDAFRVAEGSLRAKGSTVNVVEPLSHDVSAGPAAFTTSEADVLADATVRNGGEVAVVVMAFDDAGGWPSRTKSPWRSLPREYGRWRTALPKAHIPCGSGAIGLLAFE